LKELQQEIIDGFRTGKEQRCNRNLIICYSLNDLLRGKMGKFVINRSHWESDIKPFLDGLLIAAQKVYGDNVAVMTGLDSEFFYDKPVEDYDFIQKAVLDHLRDRQIFTVNIGEHWKDLKFRDQLHLANTVTNCYRNFELINSIFLVMSWMSHCPAKCFNEYDYGEGVTVNHQRGTIKFDDANNVVVDFPEEVPFSNIPMNDESLERFLGTSLYNTVRSGSISSLRTVVAEGGYEDDPMPSLDQTTDDIIAKMEAAADEQSRTKGSKPDSTGGAESSGAAANILERMSKDKPPAPTNSKGPHQPKDVVAADAVRQSLTESKKPDSVTPQPDSTGRSALPKAMPPQQKRGRTLHPEATRLALPRLILQSASLVRMMKPSSLFH
jgi:hypothetical protein